MSHLITNQKNQTVEIITNQGIQYSPALFPIDTTDAQLEKFLEDSKNYFIISKYKIDMRDESNGQKIIVYKGTILKTSPAYEYQHAVSVYDDIWFSLNHRDYISRKWLLDYEGEPTLLMPVTCCSHDVDSMLDKAALYYEEWPRNNPEIKSEPEDEAIEPETEEIEVKVTDSTAEIKIAKSRVNSFVYDGLDWINDLDSFKKLRILEWECLKGYSLYKKKALDYVYKLITEKKYSFDPIYACKEAAKKYPDLTFDEIKSGNQARVNLRVTCKKKWNKKHGL